MTPLEMKRVEDLRREADESLTNATARTAEYSTEMMRNRGVEVDSSGVFNIPFSGVTGHTLCAADPDRFILNHENGCSLPLHRSWPAVRGQGSGGALPGGSEAVGEAIRQTVAACP
ncbi:MAG: hypothetical protein U1U88_001057 [Lawsonella clevelandensis]